jgi:branched-chain amino acid transport system permease protein
MWVERISLKISRAKLKNLSKLILFLALLFVPLFTNKYQQYIVNLIFIYILLTFGLNVILGYCGQFAFAHAAFYGIGAYVCGFLITKLGIPYWFSLPVGGLAGAFAAFLLSFPAKRLERYWLAIITMSFTEIMVWVFNHWASATGGVNGMLVQRPSLFGFPFDTDQKVYYINLIVCLLMMVAGWRITSSKLGRIFVSIKEGALVTQCFGVNVSKYKVMAYAISGFYAGIAGGLLVLNLEIIVPSGFDLLQNGIMFAMVMIGGIGTFAGSIAGAALLSTLPEILRASQAYQEMIYGFLLLFIMIFMPRGLAGFIRKIHVLPQENLHIH